jgi:hypothetical protein
MGDLSPIAFDIETDGLEPGSVLTVAGLTTEMGSWLALNTAGRDADSKRLAADVEHESGSNVRVSVFRSEERLLAGLEDFTKQTINGDRHYLTAYNGERWSGGFDLPFLRWSCVRRDAPWPFPDVAYADTMDIVEGFDTGDVSDLVGVYDDLIGGDDCDPFNDSASAVATHEDGDWVPLLLHNLADIERTRELAVLAGRYIPKSDFNMKNLSPPDA